MVKGYWDKTKEKNNKYFSRLVSVSRPHRDHNKATLNNMLDFDD